MTFYFQYPNYPTVQYTCTVISDILLPVSQLPPGPVPGVGWVCHVVARRGSRGVWPQEDSLWDPHQYASSRYAEHSEQHLSFVSCVHNNCGHVVSTYTRGAKFIVNAKSHQWVHEKASEMVQWWNNYVPLSVCIQSTQLYTGVYSRMVQIVGNSLKGIETRFYLKFVSTFT